MWRDVEPTKSKQIKYFCDDICDEKSKLQFKRDKKKLKDSVLNLIERADGRIFRYDDPSNDFRIHMLLRKNLTHNYWVVEFIIPYGDFVAQDVYEIALQKLRDFLESVNSTEFCIMIEKKDCPKINSILQMFVDECWEYEQGKTVSDPRTDTHYFYRNPKLLYKDDE